METYQPIYDAVRSRLSNGDIGSAIERALHDCNLSHYAQQASIRAIEAFAMYDLPHVLYKPKFFIDGNRCCFLYGDNIQDGIVGFGESPHLAGVAFDKAWYEKLPKHAEKAGVR